MGLLGNPTRPQPVQSAMSMGLLSGESIVNSIENSLTAQEKNIVGYHRNSIQQKNIGRDDAGRPITVMSVGPRIMSGKYKGNFALVPGWVGGKILNEDQAYSYWKKQIDAGVWPIFSSGEELNKRAKWIHQIMDLEDR